MEIFCLMMLPLVAGLILSGIAILVLLILIAGAVKLRSPLVMLFMICNVLMNIPVIVVIYYSTYTLVAYNSIDGAYCRKFNYDNYQCWLYRQSTGLLWAALVMSFVSLSFDAALMAAAKRLRCLCLGVTSVSVARRDHHHAHAVVVTGGQQQVIYTTGATTYPGTAVYQPAMYQPAQPYAYQQTPYPQVQPQYQPQPNAPQNLSTSEGPPDYKP